MSRVKALNILFSISISLSFLPSWSADDLDVNKLGMIFNSGDNTFLTYDIWDQINKIKHLAEPRGLIIGRGNHQGMARLEGEFSKIHWAYLDPYAIAHDVISSDPYLIMDFVVNSREAQTIFEDLAQTFDYVVIDLRTIQFFRHKENAIYRALSLIKPDGKVILPLENGVDLSLIEDLPIARGLTVTSITEQWPFPGVVPPQNYGLDMSRRKEATSYVTLQFNENRPSLDSIMKGMFSREDNYYTRYISFLFKVEAGNGFEESDFTENHHSAFELIAQLHYSRKNEEELINPLEILALNSTSIPHLSGFIYWAIGENYLQQGNLEKAQWYFEKGREKKSIFAIYRLDLKNEHIYNSLNALFNALKSDNFKKYINGLLMSDDVSVETNLNAVLNNIAPLNRYIPGLSFEVIFMLSKYMDKPTSILEQQIKRSQQARNKLLTSK